MYEELALGENPTCQECRQCGGEYMIEKPLSLWQAGAKFAEDSRRILFVGKTARGHVGDEETYRVIDATAWANQAIDGTEPAKAGSWPYWSYTREIIERVHGTPIQEAWERVAFTNLLKCNNNSGEDSTDTTPWQLKVNCLERLRVFQREVEILQPLAIVLYTGWAYDAFLAEALFGPSWRDEPGLGKAFTKPCGNKSLPWWEGRFQTEGHPPCRVLRTGHPERKNRQDFVALVAGWLMNL